MLNIKNRTWFMIPANIAIIMLLFWGYSETVVKIGSLLAILQFALAILMCFCFDVYLYYKLQRITLESAEAQLESMKED